MWSDSHPSDLKSVYPFLIPLSHLLTLSPTPGSCKLVPVTNSDSVGVKNDSEDLSSCSSLFLSNFSPCRKLISLLCRNLLFKQKGVSSAFLHFSLSLVWFTDASALCAKEKGLIQSLVFRALLLAHHSVPYVPVVIPTNWKTSPAESR